MATYSFHRLIIRKVEIGNFYCLIEDNRILFLQKCLLNSSPHFIRFLSESLNLIGCWGNINSHFLKKVCFSKTISRLKVTYVFMVFETSLVVFFYCCATADILTKLLQTRVSIHIGKTEIYLYSIHKTKTDIAPDLDTQIVRFLSIVLYYVTCPCCHSMHKYRDG